MAQQEAKGPSRMIVMLAGGIAALVLLIAYWLLPLQGISHGQLANTLKQKTDDLAAKKQQYAELERSATPEEEQKLKDKTETMEKLIQEFEAKLPSKQEIPNLLYQFQRVAQENGIVFKKIETKDILTQEGYYKRPFSVETSADYFQATDLCHVIEYGERIGTVEGFELKPAEQEDRKKGAQGEEEAPVYVPQMNVKMNVAIFALQKTTPGVETASGGAAGGATQKATKDGGASKKAAKAGGAS